MIISKSILLGAMAVFSAAALRGADGPRASVAPALHAALSEERWQEIDGAVDRGLAWIAAQQSPDGQFGNTNITSISAEPAVTSLCIMAFLSRGHLPGYGPYGTALDKAIDFVIKCQMDNGLFSLVVTDPNSQFRGSGQSGTYNHAIAGLMLGEVYGHVTGQRMKEVKLALEKALGFTRALQTRPKANADDIGGWRYLNVQYGRGGSVAQPDSDMSVTAWHLMFLRSARNAEFNVPQTYIDDAMAFVHRCFDPEQGIFYYVLGPDQAPRYSRGLVGAGIVALSLSGEHQTPMALEAGKWLLDHPFKDFGEQVGGPTGTGSDRYYYATYYCSQAAAQLGGRYWQQIYPPLAETLLSGQNKENGSWPIAPGFSGGFGGFGGVGGFGGGRRGGGRGTSETAIGPIYPTAMAVLSLTPAYQLLPVYQR